MERAKKKAQQPKKKARNVRRISLGYEKQEKMNWFLSFIDANRVSRCVRHCHQISHLKSVRKMAGSCGRRRKQGGSDNVEIGGQALSLRTIAAFRSRNICKSTVIIKPLTIATVSYLLYMYA